MAMLTTGRQKIKSQVFFLKLLVISLLLGCLLSVAGNYFVRRDSVTAETTDFCSSICGGELFKTRTDMYGVPFVARTVQVDLSGGSDNQTITNYPKTGLNAIMWAAFIFGLSAIVKKGHLLKAFS